MTEHHSKDHQTSQSALWRWYTAPGVRASLVAASLVVLWGSRHTPRAVAAALIWLVAVMVERLDQRLQQRRTDEATGRTHRLIPRRRRDHDDPGLGRSR